jgi:hypothetical protein
MAMDIIRRKPKIGDIQIPERRRTRKFFLRALLILLAFMVICGSVFGGIWLYHRFFVSTVKTQGEQNAGPIQNQDYSVIGGAPSPEQGTLSGKICAPVDAFKNVVVAKNTSSHDMYQLALSKDQREYSFSLTPGTYVVRLQSYLSEDVNKFTSTYFTACATVPNASATMCSADSHDLVPVVVVVQEKISDVDLCDSYYGSKEPLF